MRKDLEAFVEKYDLDNQEGERLFTIVDYLLNCIEIYEDVKK